MQFRIFCINVLIKGLMMAQNRTERYYLKTNVNFVLCVTDLENMYWK